MRISALVLFLLSIFAPVVADAADLHPWEAFELTLTARNTYENGYLAGFPDKGSPLLTATFRGTGGAAKGTEMTVAGFWDGEKTWKVRFAPPETGTWTYRSVSKDSGLDGASGTLTVIPWTVRELAENRSRRGFIRVRETGPNPGHFFEHADGTPFFWLGDTWWNWTKRGASLESFRKVADDRADKGFTVGQLFVAANGWGRQSSILDPTWTMPDVAHMRHVEDLIRYANSRGITVWVHGWWSREGIDKSIGEENMRRWWRYLVARLGGYNVIWVLAGEYNMYNYGGLGLDFWKDLGRMIDGEDPYDRIIGAHPTPPFWGGGEDAPQWSTGEVIHSEPWLDYNQSQPGHGKWANEMIPWIVSRDYTRIPAKPVVVTEPWYEFIIGAAGDEDVRLAGWGAVLSGAAGHTYGGGHVWKAHVPEAPAGKDTWPMDLSFETDTLDYPGAVSLGHLASLINRIEWWTLSPHPELVQEYPAPFCAALPGELYVVYLRWGGSPKIDLTDAAPGDSLAYVWYDPRTGEDRSSGTVAGGAVRYFNAPGGFPGEIRYTDWVLLITRKTAKTGR